MTWRIMCSSSAVRFFLTRRSLKMLDRQFKRPLPSLQTESSFIFVVAKEHCIVSSDSLGEKVHDWLPGAVATLFCLARLSNKSDKNACLRL
jgi:hypothetical protein